MSRSFRHAKKAGDGEAWRTPDQDRRLREQRRTAKRIRKAERREQLARDKRERKVEDA